MKSYFYYEDGVRYNRISKTAARKLYNNGDVIVMCACNLSPVSCWHFAIKVSKDNMEDSTFDKVVNSYEYYNCWDSETGKYASYYAAVN